MTSKLFEIRDKGTFIPILAVKLDPVSPADRYLLARAGYGITAEEQGRSVMLCQIDGGEGSCTCNPYDWPRGARTYPVAHDHIIKTFDDLETGSVIDVQFILGETSSPKVSEAVA